VVPSLVALGISTFSALPLSGRFNVRPTMIVGSVSSQQRIP
jgi:hypothetical protein